MDGLAELASMVQEDFEQFDFADQPMTKYCLYHKNKHINMAAQMAYNFIECGDYITPIEVKDFIHGLNHIFFNGVAAGQNLEWRDK